MHSLAKLHTFGLQTNANKIIELQTLEDVESCEGLKNNCNLIVLGEGSNSVFINDFGGTVAINKLQGIVLHNTDTHFNITCASGESWKDFVLWCLGNNVYGLENLGDIPGSVGAAPIQNIGAFGVEVSKFIESVEYFDTKDGEYKSITNKECRFSYRNSTFKGRLSSNAIITNVNFSIPKKWEATLSYEGLNGLDNPTPIEIHKTICKIRSQKIPNTNEIGNAGSFFMNPIVSKELAKRLGITFPNMPSYPVNKNEVKLAAGWLIDMCGLKGITMGNVMTDNNNALVLGNKTGDATGVELAALASHIICEVFSKFTILLEQEVRAFSYDGEINIASPSALAKRSDLSLLLKKAS